MVQLTILFFSNLFISLSFQFLINYLGGKMPRIPRKYSQSNFYHIMVQGINKEYIFNTEQNMKKYQKLIKKKLENSNITILAYCIMNNHAHFLIYSENVSNLSKYM